MLPMHFFRNRTFALTNVASLFMFFGMFGSIFFLAQFFQTVQHYSPLQSGLRILPWTAMPIFIAPIAGALSDRIGGQRLMTVGLALQSAGLAWIAAVSTPTMPVLALVGPFVLSGVGHGALLRAGRERRAQLGAAGARGQGLGREQRDPRARRRLRRRGARRRSSRTSAATRAADVVLARDDDRGVVGARARRGRRGRGRAHQAAAPREGAGVALAAAA